MRNRQDFLDFLSYQSSVPFQSRDFDVSLPRQIDGVHTEVTVTAKNPRYLDAVKRIGYRRHDVSELVFTVPLGLAKTRADLVERLAQQPVFKYRAVVNGKVEARFVHLQASDVVNDLLPPLTTGSEIVMVIAETSDYFLGQFKIKIA